MIEEVLKRFNHYIITHFARGTNGCVKMMFYDIDTHDDNDGKHDDNDDDEDDVR